MSTSSARRRVTAADIAQAVGVSRATVGFVLNDTPGQTISLPTRERVLAAADRLGYRPHRAAKALASGRSRIVLLVLPDWPVEFTMRRHIEEASARLDEAGYALVTYTSHGAGRTRPLWDSLAPDVVMGLVPFPAEDVAAMRAAGIEHIVPDPAEEPAFAEISAIMQGPRLQVEHLTMLGHARLGFAATSEPRLAQLNDARRHHATARASELGLTAPVVAPASSPRQAADAVAAWREGGVSAVAAYNDDVAALVIGAAVRAGLAVPGDLSVVGHDDSPLAQLFLPSISSVATDIPGMGRYFAELALLAAEDRPIRMATPAASALIEHRESTARLP